MKLTPALILIEWSAGTVVGLAFVHRVARTGPGFTWLVGGVAAGVAALGAAAGAGESGGVAIVWRTGLCVLLGLAALGQMVGARLGPAAVDAAAVAIGLAAAGAGGVAAGGGPLGITRAVAGALFLGAVTVGMIVGHWYLVDPSLPRRVISLITMAFLVTVALETAVLLPRGMLGQIQHSGRVGFNAVLPGFWVALLVLTALLGAAVLGALREKGYAAVMAATGLFYLAVITAFGVEILAKALISRAL